VPLEVALGLGIALLLHRPGLGFWKALARLALVLPMATTYAVVGLLAQVMLNQKYGVFNQMIGWLGFEPVNFIGDPTNAFIAVIFWDVWQWTPFVALVLLAGLSTVPPEVEEAAELETRSWWTVLRHVQLPFLLPSLLAVLILRTADTLKLFDTVFTMTAAGPATPPSSSPSSSSARATGSSTWGWPPRRRSSFSSSPSSSRASTCASSTGTSDGPRRRPLAEPPQGRVSSSCSSGSSACSRSTGWSRPPEDPDRGARLAARLVVHADARQLPRGPVRGRRRPLPRQLAHRRGVHHGPRRGPGPAGGLRARSLRVPRQGDLWFWFITNRFVSPVVLVFPVFLISRELGLRDTHLALILMYLTFTLPIVIWICTDQFRSIPRELDEAALLEGCSQLRIFWSICLPSRVPGVAVSAS
jgi:ABC-type sugar transport system permease subunit